MDIQAVETYLRGLQDTITGTLERLDGKGRFAPDSWTRAEGGGGESRVLKGGALFEQAGVNFSDVRGSKLPAFRHRASSGARRAAPGGAWVSPWCCTLSILTYPPAT